MGKGGIFELVRRLFLLSVLFVVAMGAYLTGTSSTDWREPLRVAVYPLAADNSFSTESYLRSLSIEKFRPMEAFLAAEAEHYGIALEQPIQLFTGNTIHELPPVPARNSGPLGYMLWSLQIRWWAWRVTSDDAGPAPDIQLFLNYYDPTLTPTLSHSFGLQKGMLGLVNVFATDHMEGSNNVVIMHELLHTLGATDKYDAENMPIFPGGYAQPDKTPLYPQQFAEIMGGRIAISETTLQMPEDLDSVLVGANTAQEINWLD